MPLSCCMTVNYNFLSPCVAVTWLLLNAACLICDVRSSWAPLVCSRAVQSTQKTQNIENLDISWLLWADVVLWNVVLYAGKLLVSWTNYSIQIKFIFITSFSPLQVCISRTGYGHFASLLNSREPTRRRRQPFGRPPCCSRGPPCSVWGLWPLWLRITCWCVLDPCLLPVTSRPSLSPWM